MTRRYDKGERRYKHVGLTSCAEIVFEGGNPKKAVGKCPNTIDAEQRQAILDAAVASANGDRMLDVPKPLYAVYRGVVYEAQTSDAGWSYHGYPYHGDLSAGLIAVLRLRADDSGFEAEFDAWVTAHINTNRPHLGLIGARNRP